MGHGRTATIYDRVEQTCEPIKRDSPIFCSPIETKTTGNAGIIRAEQNNKGPFPRRKNILIQYNTNTMEGAESRHPKIYAQCVKRLKS